MDPDVDELADDDLASDIMNAGTTYEGDLSDRIQRLANDFENERRARRADHERQLASSTATTQTQNAMSLKLQQLRNDFEEYKIEKRRTMQTLVLQNQQIQTQNQQLQTQNQQLMQTLQQNQQLRATVQQLNLRVHNLEHPRGEEVEAATRLVRMRADEEVEAALSRVSIVEQAFKNI